MFRQMHAKHAYTVVYLQYIFRVHTSEAAVDFTDDLQLLQECLA